MTYPAAVLVHFLTVRAWRALYTTSGVAMRAVVAGHVIWGTGFLSLDIHFTTAGCMQCNGISLGGQVVRLNHVDFSVFRPVVGIG